MRVTCCDQGPPPSPSVLVLIPRGGFVFGVLTFGRCGPDGSEVEFILAVVVVVCLCRVCASLWRNKPENSYFQIIVGSL